MSAVSSGELVLEGPAREGWWLVPEDDGPASIVAGPFPDRADADWAAGAPGAGGQRVRPAYGFRRADGTLGRRPSPQDWAWLTHLGEQLDRLPDDWDTGMSDEDPLATLVVEIVAALSEAGLAVHDSAGPAAATGGACLSPEPAVGGVVVSWRQHDRMTVEQAHGAATEAALQQVMNGALADVLALRGFAVEAFAGGSGSVVRLAS